MPFLVIPRSLLRGGFISEQVHAGFGTSHQVRRKGMVAGRTVKTAPREGKREAKNHLMTLKGVLRHALSRGTHAYPGANGAPSPEHHATTAQHDAAATTPGQRRRVEPAAGGSNPGPAHRATDPGEWRRLSTLN